MATGAVAQAATGVQDIDGLLNGGRWNSLNVTYNFPTSASYYPADYGSVNNEPAGFVAVSESFKGMVRNALGEFSAVSGLTFTEVGASTPANTSVARSSSLTSFGGVGYGPGSLARSGDVWFKSSTTDVGDVEVHGRATWRLVLHELGHATGLKHTHEAGGPANVAVSAAHDYSDYTIMSYRRTMGGPANDGGQEQFGSAQSLMMYDIAALQVMYGANYSTNSGNTTYSWSPTTGERFENGVGQGAPGANRIYETLWDGGGYDTYDLSAYSTNLTIDLRPGSASTFSQVQRAITRVGDPATTADDVRAGGNVFNALLYQNNTASMIESAVGGSGADALLGNGIGNFLNGNAGNDLLRGYAGNDYLWGMDGSDTASVAGTPWEFYLWSDGTYHYTYDGNQARSGTDVLYSVENLSFSGAYNASAYNLAGLGTNGAYAWATAPCGNAANGAYAYLSSWFSARDFEGDSILGGIIYDVAGGGALYSTVAGRVIASDTWTWVSAEEFAGLIYVGAGASVTYDALYYAAYGSDGRFSNSTYLSVGTGYPALGTSAAGAAGAADLHAGSGATYSDSSWVI